MIDLLSVDSGVMNAREGEAVSSCGSPQNVGHGREHQVHSEAVGTELSGPGCHGA